MSKSSKRVHATCPHDCQSVCGLEVEIEPTGKIGRVYGAKDHPYTQGVICAKVARYAERIDHPARLMTPLRRVGPKGSAEFEAVSWQQAIADITARWQAIIAQDGAEAIWPYHYGGTMGLLQRDGLDRLRNALGTSRQHSTFCTALSDAGWNAGTGHKHGTDASEISDCELLVVWGCNPVNTQVNVMHYWSQAKRRNKAKLVVIDPYRSNTAKKADIHLMLQPGSDAALACAVMHILFRDGHCDRAYLRQYTDDPQGLERHLQDRDPAWAAEITGLSVEQIEAFAAIYGSTQRSFIRLGYGFSRSRNGAVNLHAVSCLAAVTGAWQHQGGGALYGQSGVFKIDYQLIKGLDLAPPSTRIIDQSRIGEALLGNPRDLQSGPKIKALLVQNTNPAVVAPDSRKVIQGLMREDLFTVVHEQFMTDTAKLADYVLPATMFLEHADLYSASAHSYIQYSAAHRPAPGQCKSNHQLLQLLANALGLDHPGFALSETAIIDQTLRNSNLPDLETLAQKHWHDCGGDSDYANYKNGFAHADAKFRFKPDWAAMASTGADTSAMPEFPDYMEVGAPRDSQHPFRLITSPSRNFLNTSFSETPSSRRYERCPSLLIHPDRCAELGVSKGDYVRIGNRLASLLIEIEPFEGLQHDVVSVEGLWPNSAFIEGLGINALISAEPGLPNGGATFHDAAIWICKAEQPAPSVKPPDTESP